ncbi:MAG: hypothetical protein WBA45_00965 [Microthrixaceae bacterium]
MEVEHVALEDKGAARVGLDDPTLAGPLVFAVAIVAVEDYTDGRSVEPVMPFAAVALGGLLANSPMSITSEMAA